MRFWSINPRLLDYPTIKACWANLMLAKKIKNDRSTVYSNHPPLMKLNNIPHSSFLWYMEEIRQECYNYSNYRIRHRSYRDAQLRRFIRDNEGEGYEKIEVTTGQLMYEFALLQSRLYWKNRRKYIKNKKMFIGHRISLHNDAFVVREGPIEPWEKPIPSVVKKIVQFTHFIEPRNI
jgi:hypothetical protein